MLDYLSLKYSWKLDTWLLKSMKQRMILKVQKVLKLLKEHKLRLLCCQRILRSFVKTIYSDTVFHMILLSLRCTKGVYPCWETLGVKKPLIWWHYNKEITFFHKNILIRGKLHTPILIVSDILLCVYMRFIYNVFFSSRQRKNTSYEQHVPLRTVRPPIMFLR